MTKNKDFWLSFGTLFEMYLPLMLFALILPRVFMFLLKKGANQ